MINTATIARRPYVAIIACLVASPTTLALSINIGGTVINDNGVGDNNPAAGTIDFRTVPQGAGFGATGRLLEAIVPGVSARLTLTDLVIGHTGFGGAINNNISFQSSPFAAIGPVAEATSHLSGRYVTVGPRGVLPPGNIIDNADIQFSGFVNNVVIIGGPVDPLGAAGVAADVPFAPPNMTARFNFGVTSLSGSLPFQLSNNVAAGNDGIADGIVLPGSASVSVKETVPLPAAVWMGGLLLAGIASYRKCFRSQAS